MKAVLAAAAGAGVPLGLSGLAWLAARAAGPPYLEEAARAGIGSSLLLGALGAILGSMVARRRVSATPLRDAVQVAAIVPAILAFFPMLGASHQHGTAAALVTGAFIFLPGPLAGGLAAWLLTRPDPP